MISVKLGDRVKALQLLGQHLGLFTERHRHRHEHAVIEGAARKFDARLALLTSRSQATDAEVVAEAPLRSGDARAQNRADRSTIASGCCDRCDVHAPATGCCGCRSSSSRSCDVALKMRHKRTHDGRPRRGAR
jgi:hypothetical protein